MNGFDEISSSISLAKQLLMDCNGPGDITLPKATLKLLLTSFTQSWHRDQDRKRSEFKKAAS